MWFWVILFLRSKLLIISFDTALLPDKKYFSLLQITATVLFSGIIGTAYQNDFMIQTSSSQLMASEVFNVTCKHNVMIICKKFALKDF